MNILFPGSFNPFHVGHLSICQKVEKLFPDSNLFVYQLRNPDKPKPQPLKVMGYDYGSTTENIDELCKRLDIDLIVRGMRTPLDTVGDDYWISYVKNNTSCELIYIQADPHNVGISSTLIREQTTRKWTV